MVVSASISSAAPGAVVKPVRWMLIGSRVSAKAGLTLRSSADTLKSSMEMSGTETVQVGWEGRLALGMGTDVAGEGAAGVGPGARVGAAAAVLAGAARGAADAVATGAEPGAGGVPAGAGGAVDCGVESEVALACAPVSSMRLIASSAPRQARTPPPAT